MRYTRTGNIYGQEIYKDGKYSRTGNIQGQEILKDRIYMGRMKDIIENK